jgi:hypothetical protein
MLRKFVMFGFIGVLAIMVGGCASVKTGLNLEESDGMFPEPIDDREPIEKPTGAGTLDDMFARVAQQVPAFGGLFFDKSGQLTMYLTDIGPTAQAAAETAIASVFGDDERIVGRPIRVLQGQYGFLQLKEWYDVMWTAVFTIPGVIVTDIQEAQNRLYVGVETLEIAGAVEAMLAQLGIPREAVIIEETAPEVPLTSLQTRHRPLVGGLQINFGSFLCTFGFNATRSGVRGGVTNSHCTNIQGGVEGTVYHQHTASGTVNRIGMETVDPPYFTGGTCPAPSPPNQCRYSDSSFMQIPHPSGPYVTADRGYIARPALGALAWNGVDRFRIVSELSGNSLVGEIVTKVGRSSGRTQGDVFASCANVGQTGTNNIILCQDRANYSAIAGDSGSPVFKILDSPRPNDVKLYGINWGSTTYSPIGNVQGFAGGTELGVLFFCARGFSC